jgi:Glucodextranase, domain B
MKMAKILSNKKILQIAGLSIFFLLIIFYGFFVSKDLIFGVRIKNVNIMDGSSVTDNIMKINGTAKNAIKLILDGREISVDQAGNFSETIALLPGYNIINLKAQDKFGNADEKNYKLIYKNI